MKPHLVKWNEDCRSKGLVVINIDNGKIDKFDAVKSSVEKAGVKFPVAHDPDAKTCETYGIQGYPSAFLIGTEGKVVWEGFPGRNPAKVEESIGKELAKVTKEELEKIKKEIEEEQKK